MISKAKQASVILSSLISYGLSNDDFVPNLLPGLLPPEGTVWRGSTIAWDDGNSYWGCPVENFETNYGVPVHIYRNFKKVPNARLLDEFEGGFIKNGGIVFYSLKLEPWAEYAEGTGHRDGDIRAFARAIREMAPHQLMVCPGYEPNNGLYEYCKSEDLCLGTVEDYKAMFANFDRIFKEEGVTNHLWAMDFGGGIIDKHFLAKDLWPDVEISWLMWNMFQFHPNKKTKNGKIGSCAEGVRTVAKGFVDMFDEMPIWKDIPWAIGAWSITEDKDVPIEDRADCLLGMRELIDSGEIPQLKA